MKSGREVDGVLVEWGARLFYPPNRVLGRYRRGEGLRVPRWRQPTADHVRRHIAAALRRAPQVMVKVTGGGRGMSRIAAHFRYISRRGTLDLENERGERLVGGAAVRELVDDWRFGGTYIPDDSHRREAFNIMFSMPPETDGEAVRGAVREVAQREFANHAYVFVLHEPGADDRTERPHVHLVVRAEGFDGRRLNPRKADLQRWREAFAEKLQERGIDAIATRRAARGQVRRPVRHWEWHARNRGNDGPEAAQTPYVYVDSGKARFNFDPNENESFYIRYLKADGTGDIKWGKELEGALEEARKQANIKRGTEFRLHREGMTDVQVTGNILDDERRVIGKGKIETRLNHWRVEVVPVAERNEGRPSESHRRALNAWGEMARALAESSDNEDRSMAIAMTKFVAEMPAARAFSVADGRLPRTVQRTPDRSGPDRSGEL